MSYLNPYDSRIGGGALPQGIAGSANRAYTGQPQSGQTAYGMLNRYTASSSPLIKRAEQRGANQAASRGMGNSSIAAGAARAAAYDAAVPLAMADQQQQTDVMLKNIDVLNAREAERAAEQMQATMSGFVSDQNSAASEADRLARLQLQREALAFEGEQNQLGRVHDTGTMRLGAGLQDYRDERLYGMDLGRMGAEYGYDIGRLGAGADYDLRNSRVLGQDQFGYNRALAGDQYDYEMRLGLMNNFYRDDPSMRDPEVANQMVQWFMGPQFRRTSSYLGGG